MNIEEIKAKIYELNSTISRLDEERKGLQKELADKLAVWKLGQRVIWRGKQYEITYVGPGYSVDEVKYFGCQVLKAGGLGERVSELWQYGSHNAIEAMPL